MKKTGSEIERDVYDLIKTEVNGFVLGQLYRAEMRPKNSVNEDAILSFMTGIDGQTQSGKLNLNVYVPDKSLEAGKVCDIQRCTAIESFLSNLIASLESSEYEFSLSAIPQRFKEDSINQHFVNCQIKFKRTTI